MKTPSLARRWLILILPLTGALTILAAENELTPQEKDAGWKSLFDGHATAGWRTFHKTTFPAKGWVVEDGWLHCLGKGGGDIISDSEFNNFELQWDWKIAPAGNSGLKYFVLESRDRALGHEYQMIDDEREPDAKTPGGKHVTASFYDVFKPTVSPPTKPAGEINHSVILVKGNYVEHWLNDVKVLTYECGGPAVQAAVAESKFKNVEGFGNKVKAHLLLQDHGGNVWFRNLKIRPLPDR